MIHFYGFLKNVIGYVVLVTLLNIVWIFAFLKALSLRMSIVLISLNARSSYGLVCESLASQSNIAWIGN